jgi:membrane-bound metal-dependent hydrolase YbcI (DUF457 family)
MMGRTHATHGACAGLALGAAWGTPPAWTLAMGGVGWVGALLPDLDTPSSTASRALGPVTGLVSWCVRGASRLAYATTKGPADEPGTGTHRHLMHSLVMAAAVGLGMWLLIRPWTPMAPQLAVGRAPVGRPRGVRPARGAPRSREQPPRGRQVATPRRMAMRVPRMPGTQAAAA